MKLLPIGLDNVILMSDEAKKNAYTTARAGGGGVNSKEEGCISTEGGKPDAKKERKWRFGEQEFEALMRSLDNAVIFPSVSLLMEIIVTTDHNLAFHFCRDTAQDTFTNSLSLRVTCRVQNTISSCHQQYLLLVI